MQAPNGFGSEAGQLYKRLAEWKVPIKDKMNDTLTNTAFSGGRYRVPNHLYDADGMYDDPRGFTSFCKGFLTVYAEDLANKVPLFMNELRTPEFRFFVDLDLVLPSPSTPDFLLSAARSVQKSVRRFYPPDADPSSFLCAISTAPFKGVGLHFMEGDVVRLEGGTAVCERSGEEADLVGGRVEGERRIILPKNLERGEVYAVDETLSFVGGSKGVKSGCHLNFRRLVVTQGMALSMREMIIVDLKSEFGELELQTWFDAVDQAVYVSAGLRMIGSLKLAECKRCGKGEGRTNCGGCGGQGKVIEDRPYTIFSVLGGEGKVDEAMKQHCLSSSLAAVHITSIRELKRGVTEGWSKVEGCPSYAASLPGTRPPSVSQSGVHQSDMKRVRTWAHSKEIVENAEKRRVVEKLVRTKVDPSHYSCLEVTTLHYDPGAERYTARVRGKGSSYCQNKRADHSSNTVYFEVGRRGITQKCFCRKPTTEGRLKGTCAKWSSVLRTLSDADASVLFPHSEEKRADKIFRFGKKN